MKTLTTLRSVLPLTLAGLLFACASPATAPAGDPEGGDPTDPSRSNAPAAPAPPAAAPQVPMTPAPPPAPAAPPVVHAIPTAKVHAAPVWSYAVANDAVWVVTDTTVERTAADGSGAAQVPALAAATTIATDGVRVYAFLDKGNTYELFSMKSDGTDGAHHLSWSWTNGDPMALGVSEGRVYFTTSNQGRPSQSLIGSIPAAAPVGGGNVAWTLEDYIDARSLLPAFSKGRLFTVDYYRQSAATRVSLTDSSKAVDVVHGNVSLVAAGIATDGVDVYTRTGKGIVKAAVGSGQGSEALVVIPSATCSIFDPADGSESTLDDALVIDGTSIYTACRAGADVEVRAYAKTGALIKVVATAPYTGGLSHLRVTSSAVYWLSRTAVTSSDEELWRASK